MSKTELVSIQILTDRWSKNASKPMIPGRPKEGDFRNSEQLEAVSLSAVFGYPSRWSFQRGENPKKRGRLLGEQVMPPRGRGAVARALSLLTRTLRKVRFLTKASVARQDINDMIHLGLKPYDRFGSCIT